MSGAGIDAGIESTGARILIITQDFPPRPGGIARYYTDLATGWGAGCTVMSGAWNGQVAQARGAESVVPLVRVDAQEANRFLAIRRATRQLRARVHAERPSIVLAGNIRPYALPVRRVAIAERIPWGFFLHGKDILRTARRWKPHPVKRLRWRLLMDAAIVIANSRFTAGEAARLGVPADHIVVVPPEVDTRRFRPPRDRDEVRHERRRLGLPLDGLLTLFVGRLIERKGLSDLFEALARTPGARLVVVGSGASEPWRTRAAAAGVADRVHFGGSPTEDDLPCWYRAADLFVAASQHTMRTGEVEGFGIVLLEAQASGLPVLATRAGGVPEAVQEDATALLVEPGDNAALAASWRRLLEDAGLRRQMSEAARAGPPAWLGPGSSARALATALAARFGRAGIA